MLKYNPNKIENNNVRNVFVERLDCWDHTQQLAQNYENPPKSIKYKHQNMVFKQIYKSTIIKVSNLDTIECSLLLKQNNLNPLVLNLADPRFAGGAVSTASGAQEESLFRTTNLFKTLITNNELYPIKDDEAIYSSKVRILKTSEKRGWKLINIPIYLDFVACCGLYMPQIDYEKESYPVFKNLEDVEKIKKKIELILQIAYLNNHDSIVLGALGCGAFNGPSEHIAKIFKEILKGYDGVFKRIHFAILKRSDDMYIVKNYNESKKDNYDIFCKEFEN